MRLGHHIAIALVVVMINHITLRCMEKEVNNAAPAVKTQKQQIKYIADMHRSQDPSRIQANIPPLVFPCSGCDRDKKFVVDPNSWIFYRPRTVDKLQLASAIGLQLYIDPNGITSDVIFSHNDKYDRIRPTNLLIACLEQNEDEVRRLLKFYPLLPSHIDHSDPKSVERFRDRDTEKLFHEALSACKMILDNKATKVLLEHQGDESLIELMKKKEEKKLEVERMNQFGNVAKTLVNMPLEQQGLILTGKFKKEFDEAEQRMGVEIGTMMDSILRPFTPEEEEQAKKEFEAMILSVVGQSNKLEESLPAQPEQIDMQKPSDSKDEDLEECDAQNFLAFMESLTNLGDKS